MAWLYHILENGTITDNSTYVAKNDFFSGYKFECKLDRKTSGAWGNHINDTPKIWNFLITANQELEEIFSNKDTIKKHLVLFNEQEYEHNSPDSLFSVFGSDSFNFKLSTGNLIGYVKKGDYTLKVSSRFGDEFLKYIIADADGFLELRDKGGKSSTSSYEWLLIYLWKYKLMKAYRLGLPKSYVTNEDTLSKVRGRIDPIDYYKNAKKGTYKCSYREHSYDNPTTRLVNAAFKKIGQHQFLQDINNVRNTFEIATKGVKYNRRELLITPHFSNPFYSDYNEVIDLSKAILKDELSDFGSESKMNAFFFDISMLFEYFVRKLIKREGFQLEGKFSKNLKIPTGSINTYNRSLEPDLVIHEGGQAFVFDVKYKNFNFKYGANREDVFQLHTYIGQYRNHYSIGGCGFIYPIKEEDWKQFAPELNEGILSSNLIFAGEKTPFHILFVKIPNEADEEFQKNFSSNCKNFVSTLAKTINHG